MFDDCEQCGSTMSIWKINGMNMLVCANCITAPPKIEDYAI